MSLQDSGSAAASELMLKTTAPRAPRDMLVRSRLSLSAPGLRGYAAIIVQAPAGFGKTALLTQWRQEALDHREKVAWLLADHDDDPQRLLQGLVQALRSGCARPDFAPHLTQDGLPASPWRA